MTTKRQVWGLQVLLLLALTCGGTAAHQTLALGRQGLVRREDHATKVTVTASSQASSSIPHRHRDWHTASLSPASHCTPGTCTSQFKPQDSLSKAEDLLQSAQGDSRQQRLLSLRGGFATSLLSQLDSLASYKLLLQACLSAVAIACWRLPLLQKNFTQNNKAMGFANAFSGGIFLMLAFGHMIPHAVEGIEATGHSSQLAFYFTLVGYLMIFFIEKIAFSESHALLHHDGHCDSHSSHHTTTTASSKLSPKSAMVLILAMSLHSFFENMALGLSTDKTSALMLAASIALHQPAESIALLVACLKTTMSTASIVKALSVYSLVGPLAVVTGVLISKVAHPLVEAVVIAITAGTFLYVGATEIANEEFEDVSGAEKWGKFGALLGGLGLMGVVNHLSEKWEHLSGHGDSHSHSH